MLNNLECNQLMDVLGQMAEEETQVKNYVLPGLVSTLLPKGKLRMFTASRYTEEFINPHSHRFDFACLVLRGSVWNTVYSKVPELTQKADPWACFEVTPDRGGMGKYVRQKVSGLEFYEATTKQYRAGEVYAMLDYEIHSIRFSRDAVVLFIEGPQRKEHSCVLQPVGGFPDNVEDVDTFSPRPWMFQKAAN